MVHHYSLDTGANTGVYNMALDETLLDWVRSVTPLTVFIVRTYQWSVPTWSMGVHQPLQDLHTLVNRMVSDSSTWNTAKNAPEDIHVVCRPTGGRAIYHGKDTSFSFITNDPSILKRPLKTSYCYFTMLLKQALCGAGVLVKDYPEDCYRNDDRRDRQYTRSPACFETQTPSDLMDANGQKIAGCAQLRRHNGLLQHGSIFLEPFSVSSEDFRNHLFDTLAVCYGKPLCLPFFLEDPDVQTLFAHHLKTYSNKSEGMLASVATTSGSHLVPASV